MLVVRMKILLLLLLCAFPKPSRGRAPLSIRIGGVFGSELESEGSRSSMFIDAVKQINQRQDTLNGTRLDSYLQYSEGTLVSAFTAACYALNQRIFALFSSDPGFDEVVGSIASKYNLPHLSTQSPTDPARRQNPFSVFLAPSSDDITDSIIRVVMEVGAERVGVVSHASTGVLSAGRLVEELQGAGREVIMLDLANTDIRPELAQLRKAGVSTCIVDVADYLAKMFITQAMQAGLVNTETTFIFTTLDFASVDFEIARYSGAQLLGLSILQPGEETSYKAGLMLDAVQLFSRGFQAFSLSADPSVPRLQCSNQTEYTAGQLLLSSLQSVEFQGVTGTISLQGQMRKELRLRVVAVDPGVGLTEVAVWSRNTTGTYFTANLAENLDRIRVRGRDQLVFVTDGSSPLADLILQEVADKYGAVLRRTQTISQVEQGETVILWDAADSVEALDAAAAADSVYSVDAADSADAVEAADSADAVEAADSLDAIDTSDSVDVVDAADSVDSVDAADSVETVDSAVAAKTAAGQNLMDLEQSLPISTENIFLVVKAEGSLLSWGVGGCLLVTLLVCSACLSLASRISPYQRRANLYTLKDSVWLGVCGLLQRSGDTRLESVSSRLVCLVWWVAGPALLVVLLIASTGGQPPTLDNFIKDNSFSVKTLEGGNFLNHLKGLSVGIDSRLVGMVEAPPVTLEQGLREVTDLNVGLLIQQSDTKKFGCNYHFIHVGSRSQTFVLRVGSVWRRRLNSVIISKTKLGRLSSYSETSKQNCRSIPDPEHLLYYICLFVLVGGLVCVLLAGAELIYFSTRAQGKSEPWQTALTREMKIILRHDAEVVDPSSPDHRHNPNHNNSNNHNNMKDSGSLPPSPLLRCRTDLNGEATVMDKLLTQKEIHERSTQNSRL